MRILMLGNSYTFYNDLPAKLAALTGAEVTYHTRGGARLSEQLNPKTDMGKQTLAALKEDSWDYVILQEMSNGPITKRKSFFKSVSELCRLIHAANVTPILYATWAYQKDSPKMARMGIGYDIMAAQLSAAYHGAAEQNDALIADVGQAFYKTLQNPDTTISLYSPDGSHPSEEGTKLAAETIASVIRKDQKTKAIITDVSRLPDKTANDPRLRILYLYQMLFQYSDPDHPMTTSQIREKMEKEHGIPMHRTTVPSDIALLQAAGVPIHAQRSREMLYYLEETRFELPELKILIDAVESSKFITETKCRKLVEKLTSLTGVYNAEKLKRNLYTSGRVRSGNEKGYYIVDAINEAINEKKQISFLYTDYSEKKQLVLRNEGRPYIVSPYILIWNGDYYYLVGYYHQKNRITTFRVDRILAQPEILQTPSIQVPKDFDILRYTREIFRMYDNQEQEQVTLLCENSVMKGVIDQFGLEIDVKQEDEEHFSTTVTVCPSRTFYAWVFQWCGAIKIINPQSIKKEYKRVANIALMD